MLDWLRISALFTATAVLEIIGCYLPWLVLVQGRTPWLLLPAALALAAFAWLLTLHPTAAGRTYAAYGGVYVVVALLWLWRVDGIALTRWDLAGAALCLAGMAVIALQPRG
jgi:small multidrug resistance family-3 protein